MRKLAIHCQLIVEDLRAALDKAADGADVHHAGAHLRGPGRTFALAIVRVLELV